MTGESLNGLLITTCTHTDTHTITSLTHSLTHADMTIYYTCSTSIHVHILRRVFEGSCSYVCIHSVLAPSLLDVLLHSSLPPCHPLPPSPPLLLTQSYAQIPNPNPSTLNSKTYRRIRVNLCLWKCTRTPRHPANTRKPLTMPRGATPVPKPDLNPT